MTRLIAPVEAARRARAAIAYAGLEQDEAATQAGIPLGTLRNIVSKTRPSSGDIDRLYAIADACNVPRTFMDEGFGAVDRWAEIEGRLRQLEAERGAPAPPGELGRRAEDSAPSDESRRRDANPEAEDQERGAEG